MNWIFDTYSSVYGTAMMQTQSGKHHAATAKEPSNAKRPSILGIFGRR